MNKQVLHLPNIVPSKETKYQNHKTENTGNIKLFQ